MTFPIFCALEIDKNNSKRHVIRSYESINHFDTTAGHANTTSLADQILEDKKYGIMKPSNGKYFTFQCLDWQGKFITSNQIKKAVRNSWENLERFINAEFKEFDLKKDRIPDFRVEFRSTKDDPVLTKSTLQYHMFPINDVFSNLRGLCVVNTDFILTIDGEPLDMHLIDPDHYPKAGIAEGATYDFDQIYGTHEILHGLGLPHSTFPHKTMSSNYGMMAEFFDDEIPQESLPRLYAKYGKRNILSSVEKRWLKWIRARMEKY